MWYVTLYRVHLVIAHYYFIVTKIYFYAQLSYCYVTNCYRSMAIMFAIVDILQLEVYVISTRISLLFRHTHYQVMSNYKLIHISRDKYGDFNERYFKGFSEIRYIDNLTVQRTRMSLFLQVNNMLDRRMDVFALDAVQNRSILLRKFADPTQQA